MPAEPIQAPVRRSFDALIAAGLGGSATGLMLALFLGRRLVATQAAAARAARAMARGEPVPAFDSSIEEAHELAEGLRDASTILDKRSGSRSHPRGPPGSREVRATSRRSLNRAKDEFVATVSHELRTPLNTIFGWLALIRTGSLDATKQQHALEVIERNRGSPR